MITKRKYEAVKNDANDKRAPGTWKVVMSWWDNRGCHAQKFAQEIYREDHARKIADAMNRVQEVEAYDTLLGFTMNAAVQLSSAQSRANPAVLDDMEAGARGALAKAGLTVGQAAEVLQGVR